MNGHVFNLERPAKDWRSGSYSLFVNGKFHNVWDGDIMGRDAKDYDYKSKLERFDFAYAVTCHKAQGSEYNNVIIINEAWGDKRLNWLYTAVTRGKTKVTLCHKG